MEFPNIVGKEVTVFTVDGKATKGTVKQASEDLLALESSQGNFIILTRAIVSFFMGKEG